MRILNQVLKRIVDVTLAIILLSVTAPLLLLIALLVRITSTGPALFRQLRVGKDGREFTILKFRSMIENAPDIRNSDSSTFNSDLDPRVTKIGRFLRKTSCDELPQLVNVLRGEMSMVGPRPELPEGPSGYTPSQFARLTVRPGITGLAAVRGRNDLPVSIRRDLDVEYAEKWTLVLDLKIMLQTFSTVLQRRGVNRSATENAPNPSERVIR